MKPTVVHSIARNEIFLCLTYPFKAFYYVSCDYFYSDFLKPTVARYAANLYRLDLHQRVERGRRERDGDLCNVT